MKREISKMTKCNFVKSLAGLFCLFLASGAPIEGMRLGNILDDKIQEQKETLRALQVQINAINEKIEAECQKNKDLCSQKKKQKVSDEDDELTDFTKVAIGSLKGKISTFQQEIQKRRDLLESMDKEIKSLDEKISGLDEREKELAQNPLLKKYEGECPSEKTIWAKTSNVLEQGSLSLKFDTPSTSGPSLIVTAIFIEKLNEFEGRLNEKIAQCYNYRIGPINLMNENDREKASRSASLSEENCKLRKLLFMAENNMTEEEFNSL